MNKVVDFILVSFSRIWKNEFRVLVTKVVRVLDKYDPKTLHLTFVYDKLVEALDELRKMQVADGKHILTKGLSEKRKNRRKLIRTLVSQVRVLNSANAVYSIPLLDVVSSFVVRYLNPIVKVNSTVQTDVLEEMFSALDADASLQAAIETLNLKTSFDELRLLQQSFNHTEMQRMETRIRRLVVTSDVRGDAEKALHKVIKEIELAQLKYPELDYTPLVEDLNKYFTFYMAQAKTRTTIRKQNASENVSTINTTTTAENGNSSAVAN